MCRQQKTHTAKTSATIITMKQFLISSTSVKVSFCPYSPVPVRAVQKYIVFLVSLQSEQFGSHTAGTFVGSLSFFRFFTSLDLGLTSQVVFAFLARKSLVCVSQIYRGFQI